MKKAVKIFAAWVVLLVLTVSTSITAFATEVATEVGENPDRQANRCELTFSVGHIGKEPFKENLAVVFYDTQTNEEVQFLLTADTAYGNGKKYSLVPDTTYEVTVTYPSSDNWKITNVDGTEISRYYATTEGLKMNWQITELTEAEKEELAQAGSSGTNGGTSAPQNLQGEGSGAEELKKFLEKTEWIADDPNYKSFLTICSGAIQKQDFLKIDGNTEEMWESYSLYEKAIYTLLFTNPHSVLMGGNAQTYTDNETTFVKHLGQFIEPVLNKLDKGQDVYAAFKEMWVWHYNNYKTNYTVVNPFADEVYDGKDAEQNGADFELTESEKNDLEESMKTAAEMRAEKASKENYISIFAGSAITLLLLCVVGTCWFLHKRKLKTMNIYDNDETTDKGK